MKTLNIEIRDPKAEKLIRDLEELELIKIREHFDEGDGVAKYPRTFGCGKGEMTILPSFYEALDEFKEYE